MAPQSVLVTGGAGFVGSSVALALRQRFPNCRVTALDNLRRRGSELNLKRLADNGVLFLHGDIRSAEDLFSIQPAPDLIVECSAEASAQAGYAGGLEYLIHTNLVGAFHCLELARRTKAALLFMSTSRVYPFGLLNGLNYEETGSRFVLAREQNVRGVSERGVNEEFPLDGPRSLYGMTKLTAELMIEEYADAYGLRYIINRCGLLTGPWQMAKSDQGVVALWVAGHFFRRPLSYIGFGGQGKQVRDFLHVADLCSLLVDQIEHFDRYEGQTWNVGGGYDHSLSLAETTRLCKEITGNEIPIGSIEENRPADVRIYVTDASKISAVNQWRPLKSGVDTISDIFKWLREEESRLRQLI